jgi:hypothetical protein
MCKRPAYYRPVVFLEKEAFSPRVGMCPEHLSFDFGPLVEELAQMSGKSFEGAKFAYCLVGADSGAETFRAQIDGTMLCLYCDEAATHLPAVLFVAGDGEYAAIQLKPCCPDHRDKFDFEKMAGLGFRRGTDLYACRQKLGRAPERARTRFIYRPCANGHREFTCDKSGAKISAAG